MNKIGSFLILIYLILFTNFILFQMLKKIELSYQDITKKNSIIETLNLREPYYIQLEQQQTEIIAIRHDIKNHFVSIMGYLNDNKPHEAYAYLEYILDDISEIESINYTEIAALNSLLNIKFSSIRNKGIQLTHIINLPKKLSIQTQDLIIIVGNILDNAIESCEKYYDNRFIEFVISYYSKILFIESKNCTNNASTDFIHSSKKNPHLHGFGIKNIRRVAAKYNGSVEILCNNDVFYIGITLWDSISMD
jgi:sensor histidine kinase regulating citrate/malate metabolism